VNIAGEVDGSVLADNENVAAMFPGASDGYDSGLDIPDGSLITPPSNYLEIYFPHAATGDWTNPFSASRWMYDVRLNSDLTNAIETYTFTVNTDQDGEDVILNFTASNDYPSDYGVVLFDVEDDNYTDLKDSGYEYDYTFDEGAGSFNFYLQLGDATAPSVTYDNIPSDGQLYDTGDTVPVEWTLTDVTDIKTTAAYYSLNGGTDWTIVGSTESDPRIFTWDKSFTAPTTFTVQGKIRVLATDWAGNSGTDISSITFKIAPHTRTFTVPLGTSLVSVPEQLNNYFVETVFADLESAGRPYIVYKYLEGTGYIEVTELEFGQGYAISLGDAATSVSVTGTPMTGSQILGLNTGWNIVGAALATTTNTHLSVSELEFSVDGGAWTKLAQAGIDGTISPFLYYNDGSGNTAATNLEPWKGYWLWVEETDSVRMRTNASDVTTPAGGLSAPPEEQTDEWFVPIVVTQGDLHDAVAGFGVREGASDGFDLAYDMPAPPSMVSFVRAVFNHPEWDARVGSHFARDMRAPFEVGEAPSWVFRVEATDPGPVTVQFDVTEFTNRFPGVTLEASYPGGSIDLTETNSFTVNYTEAFDVVITVDAMNDVADGVDTEIPNEFSIRSAHPNPFNPSVTVEFGVPEASRIRAEVFNINGRHVATLSNSTYQPGVHSLTWNAAGLPSGIYFLAVSSDHGWSASKKLLLMK
ncbi:MAG TPA: T9SS type A sorting domain-containing protein, partial [Bacteroidetes bacterium]|nr:T9SS type A sorting domain-containing protein [Bacteroidota bacterium]